MRKRLAALSLAVLSVASAAALADNELVLNEANCVTGTQYLKNSAADTGLVGVRVQGNGQNWMELVVTAAGPSVDEQANHEINLAHYKIHWHYDKDLTDPNDVDEGEGYIEFKDVAAFQHVKIGTIITISEAKTVYYNTSGTNHVRNGWIDGYGALQGNSNGGSINLFTNTGINYTTDWSVHFWGGDTTNAVTGAAIATVKSGSGSTAKATSNYFVFSGYNADGIIGQDNAAGLFVVNNDNWGMEVLNASNVQVTDWVGEAEAGWYDPTAGVGNDEMLKLEAVANGASGYMTYDYQGLYGNDLMRDGKESTMGVENQWSSGSFTQSFYSLRQW